MIALSRTSGQQFQVQGLEGATLRCPASPRREASLKTAGASKNPLRLLSKFTPLGGGMLHHGTPRARASLPAILKPSVRQFIAEVVGKSGIPSKWTENRGNAILMAVA